MTQEPTRAGTDWGDDELDLIVADYFAMLDEELNGRAYVKRRRALGLVTATGRSHKSIEFKHMNISSVLRELALPAIKGYRPMENVQAAILPAISRYLETHPAALTPLPASTANVAVQLAESAALFIEPPPSLLAQPSAPRSPGLERLVRKFDPVERDFRNRALGRAGEAIIFDHERDRLGQAGRPDLARKVRWVSEEDGDGAGYDILSFAEDGAERLLEVKTTNGVNTTPFFLTRNERALSDERTDAFRLVRVFEFARQPRVFELEPPLQHSVILTAENWRASFR